MAKREIPFIRNFNWRILLLRILINAVALFLTAALVPDIYFVDRSLASLLSVGASAWGAQRICEAGPASADPPLHFCILRLDRHSDQYLDHVFLAFFFPERFAVDNSSGPLWAARSSGLVGGLLESLLGVTPPIVADRYPELRGKVKEGQAAAIGSRIARPAMTAGLGSATAEVAEVPQ